MRRFIPFVVLLLAACASPLERCISNAGKELRVMSGLIATTQGNIDRGFGIRTEEFFENERQVCGVANGKNIYCNVVVADSREVPFAIDLNVEAAKLNSLLAKRDEMEARRSAQVDQCQAAFPAA